MLGKNITDRSVLNNKEEVLNTMQIVVKQLDRQEQIENACALLYKTHIEQAKWRFLEDNPSEIRVETKNGRKILIDRLTNIAKWFGAFEGEKLVGCFRLCGVDKNGEFEIEKYPIGTVSQYLEINRDKCLDITRVAVDQQYIGRGVTKLLFLKAFEYCIENESSLFACTHNKYLINFFKKINYPLKQNKAFKYEMLDIEAVNFYYANYQMGELSKMFEALK